MRKVKGLFFLFIILMFIFSESIAAFAMDTGFSTDYITPEEKELLLSNINLSLIKEEPRRTSIICFDVNENESVAVGTEDANRKSVLVYTSNGIFKYGYTFDCSGSFGVEWDNEDIIIYFVRSSVAASFDKEGNNIEVKKIQDTADNNSYWNQNVYSLDRTVNGNEFTAKTNMGFLNIFTSSYSQIIRTDTDGNTTTVYDAGIEYTVKFITIFIFVILFVVIIAAVITVEIKKRNRNV